ncbi:MAG: HD domain-containing protein [Anaerotignaceae bacterium]
MERFEKQMEFSLEVDKVKDIFRRTYLAHGNRLENDAEHSWHSALMAVLLAEYFPKADLLKTIKMMLFHDVVEIYAGDTYCYDTAGLSVKEEKELASAEKVYGLLPDDQKKELMELWLEFEKGESEEAKFCAILDRIQPTMLNNAANGISWKEHNIKKEQVLKRNEVTLNGPKEISEYILNIINSAEEKGYL